MPIFDRPLLTVLNRGKHLRPKQGLETVSLRIDVPVVLAEAWMIANVYAAMFHTAACDHFGDNLPAGHTPYPTLATGRPARQRDRGSSARISVGRDVASRWGIPATSIGPLLSRPIRGAAR